MQDATKAIVWLFNRTLNNVKFGITLMVLTAAYIAVGSGFASVREFFEMNELMFFGAWPLITLMFLLIINLVVVTFNRIPFTPPRYGVWMVHAGIIVLIVGLFQYFSLKTEGLAFIPMNQTVRFYYDAFHRALHLEHGSQAWPVAGQVPLHELPRFHEHSRANGRGEALEADLSGIRPTVRTVDATTGTYVERPIDEVVGLDKPLKIDVLEFWPYAELDVGYRAGGDGPAGLMLRAADSPEDAPSSYLVEGDRTALPFRSGGVEHATTTEQQVQALAAAAARVHTLNVTVGQTTHTFHVHPGGTYRIEGTPYAFDVEAFDPTFTTTTGEQVKTLQLFIHKAADELLGDHAGGDHSHHTHFRRFVIDARETRTTFDTQTDFLPGVEGAGPMGQRQETLFDDGIRFEYAFDDPQRLIPNRTPAWHRFFTLPDGRLVQMITRQAGPSGELIYRDAGSRFLLDLRAEAGHSSHAGHRHDNDRTLLEVTHLPSTTPYETLTIVPEGQRNPDIGQVGAKQVVRLRVSAGDWSQEVLVPFTQWARDQRQAWRGGLVRLPGVDEPLRLQLGNEILPLRAGVRLDGFDAVFYDGARGDTSIMRDFKSHITLIKPWEENLTQAVVQLNSPVYFTAPTILPGLTESWLFFQAQWDPENQQFTVLGVGNRPGIWTMSAGCVLITIGLIWAFYLKPVLIRRAKVKALAAAAAKAPVARPADMRKPAPVLEGAV